MTRTVSPFSTRVKISDAFFRNSAKDNLFIEGSPPSTRLYITHIDVQFAESLAGGIPSNELTGKVTFSRSTNLGLRSVQTVPPLRSVQAVSQKATVQPFESSTFQRFRGRGRFNRL